MPCCAWPALRQPLSVLPDSDLRSGPRCAYLLPTGPDLRRSVCQVRAPVVLAHRQQLRPTGHAPALLPAPAGHLRRRGPIPGGVPVRDLQGCAWDWGASALLRDCVGFAMGAANAAPTRCARWPSSARHVCSTRSDPCPRTKPTTLLCPLLSSAPAATVQTSRSCQQAATPALRPHRWATALPRRRSATAPLRRHSAEDPLMPSQRHPHPLQLLGPHHRLPSHRRPLCRAHHHRHPRDPRPALPCPPHDRYFPRLPLLAPDRLRLAVRPRQAPRCAGRPHPPVPRRRVPREAVRPLLQPSAPARRLVTTLTSSGKASRHFRSLTCICQRYAWHGR